MIFLRLNSDLNIVSIENNNSPDSSPIIGRSFFEVYASPVRKDENKVYRWLNDPENSLEFNAILNLLNGPLEYSITFNMLKNNEIMVILDDSSQHIDASNLKNFSSKFWPIFSQTFAGGFIFLDSRNRILEVSQSAIELLNLRNTNAVSISRNSVLSNKLSDYLSTTEGSQMMSSITSIQEQSLQDGIAAKMEKYFYNNIYIDISMGPVYKYGQLLGYCGYIFNVTDIVLRDEKIKEQQAMLVSSSKMVSLGEMAGGIAHEINNPLTIISTNLMLMKKLFAVDKLGPAEFDKINTTMSNTLKRISKIIRGLRVISRDASEEEFVSTKVQDICDDVIGLCQEKFKMHKVELIIKDEHDVLSQMIDCRPVQMSQVLLNLLGNAFDAIAETENKWIKIELSHTPETMIFEVVDNGPGIPLHIQDKIFQPFFTTKEVGKGTGLGLSLSYSIVRDHGGKFSVNNLNPNTSFVIEIPKVQTD